MKKLNNTVIKNLSPEMGKEIIKKYQADGWDNTKELNGDDITAYRYYGVIDGTLDCYSLKQVQSANARIIELDYEPEFSPKRGDMVMVWDDNENDANTLIYLATIEGSYNPFVTVYRQHVDRFRNGGSKFDTNCWMHMKPIPTEQPKPERDIKAEILEKFNEMNRLIEEL